MVSLTLHEYGPLAVEPAASSTVQVHERRPLLWLTVPSPRLPRRITGARVAALTSIVAHLIAALAVTIATARSGDLAASREIARQPSLQLPRLIFLQTPGPGGGGGGGGARQKAAVSRAQAAGRDQLTVPAVPPIDSTRVPDIPPPVLQQVTLEAKPLVSGTTFMTGLPDAPRSLAASQGPGSGGGAGDGRGSGMGSGNGSGFGPGYGAGYGGEVFGPGSGVTTPKLLKQVKPKYTADALQYKIQGTVVLAVVIGTDGIPLSVRVTRSLDPGLDQEAVAAAHEWRFTPGRIGGNPVNTLVRIEIEFHVV